MAGIKLADNAKVIHFSAVDPGRDAMVFTVAGSHGTLDDSLLSAKLTPSTSTRARDGPPAACAASGS